MTVQVQLRVGDKAPDFSLPDDTGATVSLHDLLRSKVIVYFYPAAMTPGCTKQACDFSASMAEIGAAGYTVIGISPDAPDKLAKFRADGGLTITLLADPDKSVLTSYGAFGQKQLYGKNVVGVIRSTFVVDEAGILTHAMYNVRAQGHVAKLKRELNIP